MNLQSLLKPVIGRCGLLEGVGYWKVPVIGRCRLLEGAGYWKVPVTGRCWLLEGAGYWKVLNDQILTSYCLIVN